ncbi:MAG: hypothetical protein II966_04515 [Lachnospiraceae bacterium]|nr:hypothetical protein [Lachnospiraceae bacterium]
MRQSKAKYSYGCDLKGEEADSFSVFEEKRSIVVSGTAYPTTESRSHAACKRALDVAVDSYTDRPSTDDMAVEMIGHFMNEEVYSMNGEGGIFRCSLAAIYIFKGKTRVYNAGNSAIMFFESGALKEVWYGKGEPLGGVEDPEAYLPPVFELKEDTRFVIIAASDMETTESAVAFFKDHNGEDPEDTEEFFKERHCSYTNLYLPKREKRGFMP